MGRPALAYENWLKSIDIDFGLRPRASEGVHFANVGGMWQEIVLGFGGMKSALNADVLTFEPCIPDEIEEIIFKVIWKGQKAEITLTGDSITVKNMSEKELDFIVSGKPAAVSTGESLKIAASGLS